MKNFVELFRSSAREMRNVRTLAVTSMLLALAVMLGFWGTVQLGDFLKVGFSFLANELAALLFGPVVGGIMAGMADILKFLVKPTGAFFPGFTISAVLGGVIYGVLLYKKPLSVPRIVAAKVTVAIVVNTLLNTFWLSILYGQAFAALLPARLLKQLLMVPIETVLFYAVVTVLQKSRILQAAGVRVRK